MKKRNMIAALLCSACLVAGSVNPVFADASKVVTLGADLTDAQKQTMMKYFNVSSDQVQVMTITNEDEHKHLDNIAPQSQIGSRTLSCAYVKPTQSGGIKVRTANLNWVTGNMIATTLSTSGVKNCEVVAACPMEVSGTGALTGIQMAYEKASGEKLDETKTKLANQEIVTTGELADKVGKNEATTVVNQSKMDVIQNGVQNADEIQNIVINVAEQNNISVSQDDIDRIVSLLKQISQQDYNYDDVKETLEQVDANTTGQTSSSDDTLDGESSDETVDVDADSSDDIVNNVNDSILGDDVIQSSTEDPGLEEETGADSQDTSNETGIPDATDDGTYSNEESSDESSTDESASDENSTEDSASDESSTDESASDEAASDKTGIPEATEDTESSETGEEIGDEDLLAHISSLKKKDLLDMEGYEIKEGETSPPKRYNSGSMILAMENAGQLIEDEELRAQIKGSGIGTSATRAEILKKLVANKYLALNKKTQIIVPTLMGEMIYDVVNASIRSLLNPELTASWEKGLTYVAEGSITSDEYMEKLTNFIKSRTNGVLGLNNQYLLRGQFDKAAQFYKTKK